MIPFRKITPADTPVISSFMSEEARPRAAKAIDRLCKDPDSDLCMAVVDGMLVFRQESAQLYVYSKPVGRGNMRLALMQMMEDASRVGYDWLIVSIRQEEKDDLRAALPHHFKFSGEEKYSYLDLLRFCKRMTDEPSIVAVPTKAYGESVFCNNETMVPVAGTFGC